MSLLKSLLAALALAVLPASAFAEDEARIAAVLSYADWCGSCQVLDPKLEQVRADGPIEGVRFVTLDYTDRDAAQYFSQADEAGVGAVIRTHFSNGVRTGMVLLIDLDDAEIVGDVRRDATLEEIETTLRTAAANT